MVICISADGEEVHMRIKETPSPNPNHNPDEVERPIRWVGARIVVLGLALTGLAACSETTGDGPLPLGDSDSGILVEEAPVEDGVVEDDGLVEDSGS